MNASAWASITPPRWLAQAITKELVTDPVNTRVLDPACGSGTFLEAAARHLIAHSGRLTPGEQLARLQENIVGIDLHPVAVQLAKASWVIARQDVIKAARKAGYADAITAPVYLGDSMQLRYDNRTLDAQGYITLDTSEQLAGQAGNVQFQIPLSQALDTDRFDNLMMEISRAVEKGDDTARILDDFGINDESERETMEATIASMEALRRDNRNHVWAYYLRNMSRPAVISEKKVDAIIGNPPWLTYSRSADIIREELESLCYNRYQIWEGGKNAPHQDVATLFYCRAAELYLKQGGVIGMVLPHSVLRTKHHLKFRKGYYEARRMEARQPVQAISLDFSIMAPWDLAKLDPRNFFPITSCVVFARLNGPWGDIKLHRKAAKPLAPGTVESWRGPTGGPEVSRIVDRLIHDDGTFRSQYETFSNQGPTIVDRRLFFVTASSNENRFAPLDTFETYPRTGTLDKKEYSVAELEGQIVGGDNLFSVYLGESLAPYVTLPPLTAALPASKATMAVPLDHSDCLGWPDADVVIHGACRFDRQGLDPNMRVRWEKMERLWEANRGKTDKKSLWQNLNWLNKLTSQLDYLRDPDDLPVRIAYTTSGRPTAALITDNEAIVDTKLYQVTCRNLDEAYYLLAIINSNALEGEVSDFRPKGLFGDRDLHKHLWKLPIPEYDANSEDHVKLSGLGRTAEQEATERFKGMEASLSAEKLTYSKVRKELRDVWQPTSKTAVAIELAVGELLVTG